MSECNHNSLAYLEEVIARKNERIAELEAECVRRKEAFESQWHLHRQATIVREEEIAALKAESESRYELNESLMNAIARLETELARAREALIDEWAWNHTISCQEQGHSVGIDDARISAEGQYKREIAQTSADGKGVIECGNGQR